MKTIVGVADARFGGPGDQLVTYALGSCLGVTIFDPVTKVAGLLHVMLPSGRDDSRAQTKPYMFVDSALPIFFHEAYRLGATKRRLEVKVAGGAQLSNGPAGFKIGSRNFANLRKSLWRNQLLIQSHDVGGHEPRTLSLDGGTGEVQITTRSGTRAL